MKTITKHYIDGASVESHGREVMDIIGPTDSQVIGRVTLGDEEDTRRAIAAAGSPTTPDMVSTPPSSGSTSSAPVAWPLSYASVVW